jgi:Ca2+-binding EF-hand superfamily protein
LIHFADADGNGYIMKDEVIAIASIFIKFTDPSIQKLAMKDCLDEITGAFFRVFDSNGNGIIEQIELNEILTDVISGFANIVSSLLCHFEPTILQAAA